MRTETAAPASGRGTERDLPRRGERHAESSISSMLEEALRDELALADGPCRALVIGPRGDAVARTLLGVGLDPVVIDEPQPASEPARADAGTERAEIVFVSSEVTGRRAANETARRSGARLCAIDSTDRLADLERAREAGFATVSLATVPPDSERSVVLLERALLLARSRGYE